MKNAFIVSSSNSCVIIIIIGIINILLRLVFLIHTITKQTSKDEYEVYISNKLVSCCSSGSQHLSDTRYYCCCPLDTFDNLFLYACVTHIINLTENVQQHVVCTVCCSMPCATIAATTDAIIIGCIASCTLLSN